MGSRSRCSCAYFAADREADVGIGAAREDEREQHRLAAKRVEQAARGARLDRSASRAEAPCRRRPECTRPGLGKPATNAAAGDRLAQRPRLRRAIEQSVDPVPARSARLGREPHNDAFAPAAFAVSLRCARPTALVADRRNDDAVKRQQARERERGDHRSKRRAGRRQSRAADRRRCESCARLPLRSMRKVNALCASS